MEILKSLISKLPLGKIKFYLTVAGVLLIAGLMLNLQIVNNKNAKLEESNRRITANIIQLTGEKRQIENYVYKQAEVNGRLRLELDSLAKELRVKPKYITRIEYRTITEKDTVVKEVFVEKTGVNTWNVQDSGQCWRWEGIANLSNDDLTVKRTDFSYQNKVTDVFYRKRPEGFFGFLRKRVNYHKVVPECGTVQETTFEFIK